jgi:protein gp37
MKQSNIAWTDYTWNVAVGCTKVDGDCKYCYMYRDSFDEKRYNPREIRKTTTVFNKPLKLAGSQKVFTSSLTDFFHEDIDPWRDEAWSIIRQCPQHQFQILTKRPERIYANLPEYWGEIKNHVWLGTSVGNEAGASRISKLMENTQGVSRPSVRFLSLEPLWGRVRLSQQALQSIDWVIVGGESGNNTGLYRYRPCELDWIQEIVDQCLEAGVAVFVKQLGTYLSLQLNLESRHGQDINEFPYYLQYQQFPK